MNKLTYPHVLVNRSFDELGIGDAASLIRILCDDDIKLFAAASGDIGPMHPAPTHMRPVASSAKVVLLAAGETVNSVIPATLDAAALSVMAIRGQIAGSNSMAHLSLTMLSISLPPP